MINIQRIFSKPRLIKALTGLNTYEFNKLSFWFGIELTKRELEKERKRKPGAGAKHTLRTPAEKFFFILFYAKCYPVFDLCSFLFNVDNSQPCRWVDEYLPILEKVLGKEIALPARKINSIEEFIGLFPDIKEVIIDGTERPIQRPKDKEKQKANYSGKKKRHTRKNILLTDKNKKILFLDYTNNGKEHDKTLCVESGILKAIPKDVILRGDLGFLGIDKDFPDLNIILPKKKPKKQELSYEDKENNKQKAKERIIIEHSIGGVKRFRSVSDVFRSKRKDMDDKLMLVSCGLWNYHLKMLG